MSLNIKKLLNHSLSDTDIKEFFNNQINVLKFSELANYDHIDDVLGRYGRCIILFENNKLNTGHWVALHYVYEPKKKPYIKFMDSYGHIIEDELNWIPKSFQNLSNQQRGLLIKLLLNQPLKVHYSQYRLQHLGKLNGVNVNTCGIWSSLSCLFNTLSEDEFNKLMRSGEKFGVKPDELACKLFYDELGAINIIQV